MKDENQKKPTHINLEKLDRALETHYIVVYLVESEDKTSTTTECIKIPFDIEEQFVLHVEDFGDVLFVQKDTYVKWTGEDIFYDGKLVITKGQVYDVLSTENGRVIIDLGDKMYGWVRPNNFEFFEVGHELDYENSTIH